MEDLMYKFRIQPQIMSLMIPYDWNEISPHITSLVYDYVVVETARVIEKVRP